ncbi:MAG TPA: hypothetical protein PLI09_21860 [Candidatus Hydrogenedentes bacterium]|mgnify:CR=1 FL=1|nr:hypothetical protein [Candidatus Hydrogenedentota bacterium]
MVALLLLGITIISGIGWWSTNNTAGWRLAPATLLASNYPKNVRFTDLINAPVELKYGYTVKGKTYQGKTSLGWFQKTSLHFLPESASKLPPPTGYVGIDDMPREIQELLESHGIVSLDKIPKPFLESLHAKGYTTVNDMPTEFKDALKKEDYTTVAKMLDTALDTTPPPAPSPPETTPDAIAENLPETMPPSEKGDLYVLYDPDNPHMSKLDLFPALHVIPSIAPFFLGALISVIYCAWGYPWLKQLRSS